MNKQMIIAGHETSVQYSKDGSTVQRAWVMVGGEDKPGWRSKDGDSAFLRRREVKLSVAKALGLPKDKVRIQARYSCLQSNEDGTVSRVDSSGHVIGTHLT